MRRQSLESKGVEVARAGIETSGGGRRDATGEKVLKESRSPRRRGRMGTSARRTERASVANAASCRDQFSKLYTEFRGFDSGSGLSLYPYPRRSIA